MNNDPAETIERIRRLEVQMKRLRRIAYLVWPAVWLATTIFLFATTKLDAKALRILMDTAGLSLLVVSVISVFLLAVFFVVKTASDYKNRGSYVPLNPGSKRQ